MAGEVRQVLFERSGFRADAPGLSSGGPTDFAQ